MDNRTMVLFELEENLYREGCPVLLLGGALSGQTTLLPAEDGGVEERRSLSVTLRFQNIDPRPISSLYVDIHVFDRLTREVAVLRDKRYLLPYLPRGGVFGAEDSVPVPETAETFSVAVKKAEFEGGEVWTGSGSILFERVPDRVALEEKFQDGVLLEQFRRDFAENLAEDHRIKTFYVPASYKDLWFCACGEINHADEEKCAACGAALEPQLALIEDEDALREHHEAREKAIAEEAERQRLEAERKAAEEKAAAEERARLAAEAAAAAEKARKRRKRRIIVTLSVSIPAVIAVFVFLYVYLHFIQPQMEYDRAAELLASGDLDAAETAFAALDTFSDSRAQLTEIEFLRGEACMEKGEYEEAISHFDASMSHEGAAEYVQEAKYQLAVAVMERGDWEGALDALAPLGDYKDVMERTEQCVNGIALETLETDGLAALDYWDELTPEHQAALEEKICEKGIALYEQEQDGEAEKYFTEVKTESLREKIREARYARAEAKLEAGALDEAKRYFTALGDYKDCADKLVEIEYLRAQKMEDEEDFAGAVAAYESLGDYKDSEQRLVLAKYGLGLQQLESGDTMAAYETLYAIRTHYDAWYKLITDSRFYRDVYDPGLGINPNPEKIEFTS